MMDKRKFLQRRQCLAWLSASAAWGVAPVKAQTPTQGAHNSNAGNVSTGSNGSNGHLAFGMVPYLPVQQLVRLYEPVVGVFERTLARPCRLGSATDFIQFIERARSGDFDLVGASPHVARILHREEHFIPLVRATAPLEPLIIVPQSSPVRQLKDLAQQSLLVADPFAVHVLIALRHLRDQGLVPGRDVKLLVAGTQRNGVQRLLKGDAAAAVGSASTLNLLPAELSSRFRVLAAAPKGLTPMAYLAHPRLRVQVDTLSQNLLAFGRSKEGQALLKETQHEGLSPLTAAEMISFDPLVVEFYKQRSAN